MLSTSIKWNDNVFPLLAPFGDGGENLSAGRFGCMDGLRPHFASAPNVNDAALNLNGRHFFDKHNLHSIPPLPAAMREKAQRIQQYKINLRLAA